MCGSNYALAHDGKYYHISNWTKPGTSSGGECLSPRYSPEKEQPESNISGDGEEATEVQQELTDEVVLVDDSQNSPPAIQHFRLSPPPVEEGETCLLYTSPSPRDGLLSRMPSSA